MSIRKANIRITHRNKVLIAIAAAMMSATVGPNAFAQAKPEAKQQAAPQPKTQAKPAWKSPEQVGSLPFKTRPSGDKEIIHAMADRMGFVRGMGPMETTETLNRLQWYGLGQVIGANGALVNADYSYAVSLSLGGAREDIKPASGSRIARVVVGDKAWNETAPGVGGTWANDQARARRLQYARTPFGFVKTVLKAAPGTVKVTDSGPGGPVTLSLDVEGVSTVATLDPDYRPAKITMRDGSDVIETTYLAYSDLQGYGIMFPARMLETVKGRKTADLRFTKAHAASYVIFPPPAN
jgi:hypothetical protein